MQLRTKDLHSAVSFHDRSFLPTYHGGRQEPRIERIILFLSIRPMMVTRGKLLTCHLTNQTTQLLGDSDRHIASWVKPPSYRILSFHILALISVDLVCCMLHFSSLFLFLTSQSILRISTLDAAKLAMCRGDWGRKSRCGS